MNSALKYYNAATDDISTDKDSLTQVHGALIANKARVRIKGKIYELKTAFESDGECNNIKEERKCNYESDNECHWVRGQCKSKIWPCLYSTGSCFYKLDNIDNVFKLYNI